MVDFGRLKSPLPDSEIVLKMIRKLRIFYNTKIMEMKHISRKDYPTALDHFMAELNELEDVAEKSKILIVRLTTKIIDMEKKMNSYRRNLKKTKKENPNAKQHIAIVDSYLEKIRNIKKKIRNEAESSAREEKWIRDEAA